MATRTVTLSTGGSVGTGKARSRTVTLSLGPGLGIGSVPWGGSPSLLDGVPWIPKAGTPFLLADGRTLAPVWDRCLRWLFETAIGGIRAPTPAQIHDTVAAVKQQAVETASYAEQVVGYVQGVAATATATAEVAQSNNLAGASSIPPPPDPPERPRSGGSAL